MVFKMHGDSHTHQLASRIKITEKTERSVLTSLGKSCLFGKGGRGGGLSKGSQLSLILFLFVLTVVLLID